MVHIIYVHDCVILTSFVKDCTGEREREREREAGGRGGGFHL